MTSKTHQSINKSRTINIVDFFKLKYLKRFIETCKNYTNYTSKCSSKLYKLCFKMFFKKKSLLADKAKAFPVPVHLFPFAQCFVYVSMHQVLVKLKHPYNSLIWSES